MNAAERIAQWVEFKIGKLLTKEINEKIVDDESEFDVDSYAQQMFETHFLQETQTNQLKVEELSENLKLDFESDDFYLSDGFSQDSSDDDRFDFVAPSLESIVHDLKNGSIETQEKALGALQATSAEDLVVQTSWTMARKMLQDILKTPESSKLHDQVLETFRRFLLSHDLPRVVCEGFVTLTESITFQIDALNSRKEKESIGYYNFKDDKWFVSQPADDRNEIAIEIIFKSMWLLIQSQNSMPSKWSRFNEKRLTEIAFAFVHMLSSKRNHQGSDSISALDILSVLDPMARWCNHWCHGATGRSLLCSALKTHKKFFSEIVDFILITIKNKEPVKIESRARHCTCNFKLPPLYDDRSYSRSIHENENSSHSAKFPMKGDAIATGNHSAPPISSGKRKSNEVDGLAGWLGISKEIVKEAKLCHCLSMVVCLMQYRGGRSLFPLEVTSKKRRMTLPDLVSTIGCYLDGVLSGGDVDDLLTDAYKAHIVKLTEILKSV